MHWFNYVWIFMLVIAVLIWAFFSIRDIIDTVRNTDKVYLYRVFILFEEYTQWFIIVILVSLFISSFAAFFCTSP